MRRRSSLRRRAGLLAVLGAATGTSFPASPAAASSGVAVSATFGMTHVTAPRPCRVTATSCTFAVTARAAIYLDGVGYCDELANAPGGAGLGCVATLSGTIPTVGPTCSNLLANRLTLSFASVLAPSASVAFPVEGKLTGGMLEFSGVVVDHRGFQLGESSGMILGLCGTGPTQPVEAPPAPTSGWIFTGTLDYADL